MMRCPTQDLLSSYVDGEASAVDSRSLEFHLGQCAECLREMRLLRAMKARLACIPTPAMPQELASALERMVPGPIPVILPVRVSGRNGISRRVCAWGVCAAITVACAFWLEVSRREPQEVPVEWLLAEYRRDAAELPLAAAERAMPEESPPEVSHDY